MSGRVLYDFNTKNNTKSWNINAYRISSISGDDLILQAGTNGNLKIEGNIIPSLSENYDLGDNKNKLRYIYVNQINGDVSGNASTCIKLQESVKIGGVDFTGENGINLPGVNMIGNQDTTGNAATATRLRRKLKLGGIEWDGSHDISLAGVNMIGNQDTTGKANSARKADSLINDNSYANIKLKDGVINYLATSHNFDGSLNNIQIRNLETKVRDLTNEVVVLKQGLNTVLTQLGLSRI